MAISLPAQINELHEAIQRIPAPENPELKQSFDACLAQEKRAYALFGNPPFRVVFIGKPGVGKTTAICHWLNLLKVSRLESDEKSTLRDLDDICLLHTKSGRTTLCETHILPTTETSRFELEYLPIEEQEKYLQAYCDLYIDNYLEDYAKRNDNDDYAPISRDNGMDSCIVEINRFIEKMLRKTKPKYFPQPTKNSPKRLQDFDRLMTPLREGVKREPLDYTSRDNFFARICKIINLSNRLEKVIPFTGEQPFEEWLSKTFRAVNTGSHPNTSIPTKISIFINPADHSVHFPSFVKEVIDTRGLDGNPKSRSDLEEFLHSKDTLCVFVDEIEAPPTLGLETLLKNTFPRSALENASHCMASSVDPYHILVQKTSLLVCPTRDISDTVEEEKRREIKDKIRSGRIPLNPDNIHFLNASKPYRFSEEDQRDENGELIYNKDGAPKTKKFMAAYYPKPAKFNRDKLDSFLSTVIDSFHVALVKEEDRLYQQLQELQEEDKRASQETLRAEKEQMRAEIMVKKKTFLESFISSHSDCFKTYGEPVIDEIRQTPWQTVRAFNLRFGGDDFCNLLTTLFWIIEGCANEQFKDYKNIPEDDLVKILASPSAETRRSIAPFKNELAQKVEDSRRELLQKVDSWAKKCQFSPRDNSNEFWVKINNIRGKGTKDRMVDAYRDFLYDSTILFVLDDYMKSALAGLYDFVADLLLPKS